MPVLGSVAKVYTCCNHDALVLLEVAHSTHDHQYQVTLLRLSVWVSPVQHEVPSVSSKLLSDVKGRPARP